VWVHLTLFCCNQRRTAAGFTSNACIAPLDCRHPRMWVPSAYWPTVQFGVDCFEDGSVFSPQGNAIVRGFHCTVRLITRLTSCALLVALRFITLVAL